MRWLVHGQRDLRIMLITSIQVSNTEPRIIPVFLDMYDYIADEIWLDRAKESYDELFRQAIRTEELPKWSYAYSYPKEELGLSPTGIK